MAGDMLNAFFSGLKSKKTGNIITTVKEFRENQFGIPLRHYAQQYLFGATGLRLQSFNSIQGKKEVGKSTTMFDIMGDVLESKEDGGQEGLCVLYELEGKISPSILYSILNSHGERAVNGLLLRTGMTLEEAMEDMNVNIIPTYMKVSPDRSAPLFIGFDSIGGSATNDTVGKLKSAGFAGKGYYDKQHFMKYFCENQGMILMKQNIPAVVMCINQEREQASSNPFSAPVKTITGGQAQMFKDGHMISASKEALRSGDGNIVTLRTTKTSFCDCRKIKVDFRWNRYGAKTDDAYEARFLWSLASARCLDDPDRGIGQDQDENLRDICDVKVSDADLVTCPQLGLKSVRPEEFEEALMASPEILDRLYTFQKIEKLRGMDEFATYVKTQKDEGKGKKEEPEADTPKTASKGKKGSRKQSDSVSVLDVPLPPMKEDTNV